ncbi:MAG TPA: glycosyltransferase family 2 protein [Candidatus Limnocylindrales bacterium]|nr:glycosyltransferase family 2 protein [Candidatus Limnocylindrales bacterium]
MIDKSRVSIVIPVYNEAANLPACLDAIAAQTDRPYEVLVIDNNSSDDSAEIAASYDFVAVITERRQGVVHARNAGFDLASGDIIGRIDADTVLSVDWVAAVRQVFEDQSIGAATGRVEYHDLPIAPLFNGIDLRIRRYLALSLGNNVAMQGANMAIRRSVWKAVRKHVCNKSGMHEDFDLSVHAAESGNTVRFDESMLATVGCRQIESDFVDYVRYILLSPRTYALHGLSGKRYMYPVVCLALIGYLPLRFLHRGYDPELKTFIWKNSFGIAGEQRVNPATYVD